MAKVEIVCWNGEGPIPAALQAMIDEGQFDCPECQPVMHVHTKDDGLEVVAEPDGVVSLAQSFSLLVGHPDDCPIAKEGTRRAAGALGLN